MRSRSGALMLGGVAMAVLIVGAVWAAVDLVTTPGPLIISALLLITGAQWVALRRGTGQVVPAVGLLVAIVNIVGYFGYDKYRSLASQAAVSAALPNNASVYSSGVRAFVVVSVAATVGGLLAGLRATRTAGYDGSAFTRLVAAAKPGALSLGAVIPLLILGAAYTPAGLWSRSRYNVIPGSSALASLASLTVPLGVIAAGLVYFDKGPNGHRAFGGVVILGYLLGEFASGGRTLGLIPPLLVLAFALRRGRRPSVPTMLALVFLTLLAFQLPLTLRTGGPAGISPYWSDISQSPGKYVTLNFTTLFGNVLFALPLTGTIATSVGALPLHDLVTSLSPLPGRFTDWPALAPQLRLNQDTPYNAVGELNAYGTWVLASYFLVVAFLFARFQQSTDRMSGLRAIATSLISLGFMLTFSVTILEYNLRAANRFVWYEIAAYAVLRGWPAAAPDTQRLRESLLGAPSVTAPGASAHVWRTSARMRTRPEEGS